jgi:hypothetical protein
MMCLATCKIRSAERTSGSIEITSPGQVTGRGWPETSGGNASAGRTAILLIPGIKIVAATFDTRQVCLETGGPARIR